MLMKRNIEPPGDCPTILTSVTNPSPIVNRLPSVVPYSCWIGCILRWQNWQPKEEKRKIPAKGRGGVNQTWSLIESYTKNSAKSSALLSRSRRKTVTPIPASCTKGSQKILFKTFGRLLHHKTAKCHPITRFLEDWASYFSATRSKP